MADLPKETPEEEATDWSRRQFLTVGGGALLAGAVALFGKPALVGAARSVFGSPVQSGLINVYAFDYYYVPNFMTWRVGDKVTLRFQNNSHTHFHEMQIGKHVNSGAKPSLFGPIPYHFGEDFMDGVHVTVSKPYKIDNLATGKAIVTYDAPKSLFNLTTGHWSPTLEPGGSIDINFTVPNKPGTWHYGCFVQHYIHHLTGMKGTIQILPA